MSHARDRIHAKYCPDLKCDSNGIDSPGDACLNVDYLLTLAEDERAHDEAQKLVDAHEMVLLTHGPQVAQGLALAVTLIDPYEVRDDKLYRRSDGKEVVGLKPGERRHD